MRNFFKNIKDRLSSAKNAITSKLSENRAEGFVDTGVKIIISVVIGGVVLAGLYALFNTTIIPTLIEKIQEMFNYGG